MCGKMRDRLSFDNETLVWKREFVARKSHARQRTSHWPQYKKGSDTSITEMPRKGKNTVEVRLDNLGQFLHNNFAK